MLDSPYREVTRPVVDYVRSVRRESPRDLVVVFVPEYVVGHWWEQLLHNQSALRLKTRLHFTPGVMVASVPWQLASSEGLEDREDGLAPAQPARRRSGLGPRRGDATVPAAAEGASDGRRPDARRDAVPATGRAGRADAGARHERRHVVRLRSGGRARRPLRGAARGPGGLRPARAAR